MKDPANASPGYSLAQCSKTATSTLEDSLSLWLAPGRVFTRWTFGRYISRMEITPFRDYSNALLPLPPLNGAGSPFPSTQPDRTSPFRDEIAKALGPDVSQAGYSAGISSPDSSLSAGSAVESSADNSGTDPLMDVCRQLEGFLLSLLLRDMGKSFAGSTLFSQTYQSSIYRDMFFTEVGRSIGERPPGLGIADAVYRDTILKESEAALSEPEVSGSGPA